MRVPILILGLVALAAAGTLITLASGDYLSLEEHRLEPSRWRGMWWDTNPDHFRPEVHRRLVRLDRLAIIALATAVIAAALIWFAFALA